MSEGEEEGEGGAGMGWDGRGGDEMGWDGMGWNRMGWDGMGGGVGGQVNSSVERHCAHADG